MQNANDPEVEARIIGARSATVKNPSQYTGSGIPERANESGWRDMGGPGNNTHGMKVRALATLRLATTPKVTIQMVEESTTTMFILWKPLSAALEQA